MVAFYDYGEASMSDGGDDLLDLEGEGWQWAQEWGVVGLPGPRAAGPPEA